MELVLRKTQVDCDQLMDKLSPEKITPNLISNCVGVDFYGHFIKYPNQRKGKLNKTHTCAFLYAMYQRPTTWN